MTTPRPRSPLTPRAVDALLVDTTPWLSCDECFERMDVHVEAVLADPHHHDAAMEHHLLGCAACADEARSLLDLLRSGTA